MRTSLLFDDALVSRAVQFAAYSDCDCGDCSSDCGDCSSNDCDCSWDCMDCGSDSVC